MLVLLTVSFALIVLVPNADSLNDKECGKSSINSLPVTASGHTRAQPGQFPWMVAITKADVKGISCSGILISKRHILTTAHCFDDSTMATQYEARIGNSTDWTQRPAYDIQSIRNHDNHKRGLYYDDISLLTLTEPVDDPSNAICLPDDRTAKKIMTGQGTVTGWGFEKRGGPVSNTLLIDGDLKVVSNKKCNNIFEKSMSSFRRQFSEGISSGILCAKSNNEDREESCGGMSGSPLMYKNRSRWYAVGLTTFGYGCRRDFPVGYTRVSSYLDWIQKHTE